MAKRPRRPRAFERGECRGCIMKGSTYCWRQCPYNTWRRERFE